MDFNAKRQKIWQGVLEKLKNRVANWAFRTLNIVGRVVLVKSVLQATPISTIDYGCTTRSLHQDQRNSEEIHLGRIDSAKEVGLSIMETPNETKGGRRLGSARS